MSEYTPDIGAMEFAYVEGYMKGYVGSDWAAQQRMAEADFRRGLAVHDAEVAAKALEHKEAAYQAVRDSGLLTDDAYLNARIWRAVETALGARIREGEQ